MPFKRLLSDVSNFRESAILPKVSAARNLRNVPSVENNFKGLTAAAWAAGAVKAAGAGGQRGLSWSKIGKLDFFCQSDLFFISLQRSLKLGGTPPHSPPPLRTSLDRDT